VVETLAKLNAAFDELRYDEMADAIYHFVWGTFCDWYVELVKGAFDEETKRVAAWAFDQILVMLHPLMPFITEELWHANQRPYDLIVAKWPEPQAQVDQAATDSTRYVINLIDQIRSARQEVNVPPAAKVKMVITQYSIEAGGHISGYWNAIGRLGRLAFAIVTGSTPESPRDPAFVERMELRKVKKGIQIVMPGMVAILELEGVIDMDAEKARLSKAAEATEKERDSLAARLSNPNFVERAKPEAVEKARADHAERAAEAERLRAALERLG
jgi:valyl-tRNA synthetase